MMMDMWNHYCKRKVKSKFIQQKRKVFRKEVQVTSVPSHFNESPFANSIPENPKKVNSNERNSE